jgi:hypothetical protein
MLLLLAAAPDKAGEAIIHVGPHKTGSSSLQAALLAGPLRQTLQKLDHIKTTTGIPGAHHGFKNHANLANELRTLPSRDGGKALNFTLAWARGVLKRNPRSPSRIFLTAEDFSRTPASSIRLLMRSLRALGFARSHVVIVYRRLFERLVSLHSETFLGRALPKGGYAPLVDWLDGSAALRSAEMQRSYNQTIKLRAKYAAHASVVSVMNMHINRNAPGERPSSSSLLRRFICNHLRAATACAQLTPEIAKKTVNVRPRDIAPLRDLTWAAAAAMGSQHHPPRVAMAAADQLLAARPGSAAATALAHIPMRCANSAVLSAILQATESEEKALFPTDRDRETAAELRAAFALKNASGAFCSAKSGAALEQLELRSVVRAALTAAAARASPVAKLTPRHREAKNGAKRQ